MPRGIGENFQNMLLFGFREASQNLSLFRQLFFITCPRVCQIQDLCRKKYKKRIFSEVQWWKNFSTHFSDSTHQECMIFARIGNGPCYHHWTEIFAGVKDILLVPTSSISSHCGTAHIDSFSQYCPIVFVVQLIIIKLRVETCFYSNNSLF